MSTELSDYDKFKLDWLYEYWGKSHDAVIFMDGVNEVLKRPVLNPSSTLDDIYNVIDEPGVKDVLDEIDDAEIDEAWEEVKAEI